MTFKIYGTYYIYYSDTSGEGLLENKSEFHSLYTIYVSHLLELDR